MTIDAVFLDVDETLVDFNTSARAAHEELFGDGGYDLWCELTPRFWPLYTHGGHSFEQMRVARMDAYLAESGLAADASVYEARRWGLLERSFVVFDDVWSTLGILRGNGLRLGVITNNESVHQRRKLATVGLEGFFDAVVISGEVGVAKPDAAIFEHACELLGVGPGAALHVGDSLDADALGAHGAGLTGVWLDRDGRHDGGALPVPVIDGLAALPDLV